ncbi:MAG TPA: hypothetical protein VFU02_14710 [Polyangiaceae bacterium]|nr:hypothetical protein [Polyangiaceae bacterium]
MADGLRQLLMRASPANVDRTAPPNAVRYAYGKPQAAPLVAKARSLWSEAQLFVPPLPGETLLLATAGASGSLWVLKPQTPSADDGELSLSCREQLALSRRIVSRELPLISDPAGPRAWTVEPIKARQATVLRGDSFGLSFCLAMASAMLKVELPDNMAASAAVHSDGTLHPVEGLAYKLEVLRSWAPNVRVLLVSSSQLRDAAELVRGLEDSPEVVGIDSLASAIERAFPNLVRRAAKHWTVPETREQLALHLFHQTLEGGGSLLRYSGIANACEELERHLPSDNDTRRMLEFTRVVAAGHDSAEAALPLHRGWLARLRAPLKKRVVAHIVNRSLYATASERRNALDYAEALLSPDALDDDPESLEILGALGRVHGPLGEYVRALQCLERALEGWIGLRRWASASYALSELVRVIGVSLGEAELAAAVRRYVSPALASGELEDRSRAFVVFGVGRAFAQQNNPAQCLYWFRETAREQSIDWADTPLHLQASRLRWEAAAATELGDARAHGLAAELEALGSAAHRQHTEFAWVLHRLDGALRHGDDGSIPHDLERFRKIEPRALELTDALAATPNDVGRARSLTRHYPY